MSRHLLWLVALVTLGCGASTAAPQVHEAPAEQPQRDAAVDWLSRAVAGRWTGVVRFAPHVVWTVELQFNPDGGFERSAERVPTDGWLCPPAADPYQLSGWNGPLVGVWQVKPGGEDAVAAIRASTFYDLMETARHRFTGLRFSRDANSMQFEWRFGRDSASAGVPTVLRRASPPPALPPVPPNLAWAGEFSEVDTSILGCEKPPGPDDAHLNAWPEGITVALAIPEPVVGAPMPVGAVAWHPDVDRSLVAVDVLEGSCTVTMDQALVAQSDEAGACSVRIFAPDRQRTRKVVHRLLLSFKAQGPPGVDQAGVERLYSGAFLDDRPEPTCPPPDSWSSIDHVFPNVLQVTVKRGSGIRARGGKLVFAFPAAPEANPGAFRRLLAVLRMARRYVALRILPGREDTLTAKRVTSDLQRGGASEDYNRMFTIYLDVPNRAALARLATALHNNPTVSCVQFKVPPTVGFTRIESPPPVRWPTAEQIAERETDREPWRVQRRHQRPPGGRPPRSRPPSPK